jgi:hypothetical protein
LNPDIATGRMNPPPTKEKINNETENRSLFQKIKYLTGIKCIRIEKILKKYQY